MIFGNVENNSCRHAADLLLTKGRVQLRKKKPGKILHVFIARSKHRQISMMYENV